MRYFLTVLFLLCSSQAFALTAEWERNVETDMKDYHIYMCLTKDCIVLQTAAMRVNTVIQTTVGVKPTFTIPAGQSGSMAVSARDTSLNESGLSNIIFFDQIPPKNPAGLATR